MGRPFVVARLGRLPSPTEFAESLWSSTDSGRPTKARMLTPAAHQKMKRLEPGRGQGPSSKRRQSRGTKCNLGEPGLLSQADGEIEAAANDPLSWHQKGRTRT